MVAKVLWRDKYVSWSISQLNALFPVKVIRATDTSSRLIDWTVKGHEFDMYVLKYGTYIIYGERMLIIFRKYISPKPVLPIESEDNDRTQTEQSRDKASTPR